MELVEVESGQAENSIRGGRGRQVNIIGYIKVIINSNIGIGIKQVTTSSISIAIWLIKAVSSL